MQETKKVVPFALVVAHGRLDTRNVVPFALVDVHDRQESCTV